MRGGPVWYGRMLLLGDSLGDGGLGVLGIEDGLGGGGQPSQPLDLAGNDDLGSLAVGGGGEGLQGFDLDDAVAGVGLVDELDGVGGGLLYLHNGLGLGLSLQDLGLLGALGLDCAFLRKRNRHRLPSHSICRIHRRNRPIPWERKHRRVAAVVC